MPAWQGGCRICHQRRQQTEKVRQRQRVVARSWLEQKGETERMKQLLYLWTLCSSFKSRQLTKLRIVNSIYTWPISLAVEIHFQHWIWTHTQSLLARPKYIQLYLSRDPQVKGTSVCPCVCVTVHACVTLCVGGCTCVFIKKYQLFWSVAHHSSHSPLSCTHLTRPKEKKGEGVWQTEKRVSKTKTDKSRRQEEAGEEDVFIIKVTAI